MYQSPLDPLGKLTFPFDPLRALHARSDSELRWPEYPYKQVLIDRVRHKVPGAKISVEAAAGALLMALGEETGALFEIEQQHPCEDDIGEEESEQVHVKGRRILEQRFLDERSEFQRAKRAFLQQEKKKVQSTLDSIDAQRREEQEREVHDAWARRQIVRRYDDGSKYDGDGVRVSNVLVPHGHGTLWVSEKKIGLTETIRADIKRVPRYIGMWMDGFMHGRGTYFWSNGDSWTGNFMRDELQGKGMYTFHDRGQYTARDGDGSDTSRNMADTHRVVGEERVRYYDASQHVCWGDELVRGCRLMLFINRHYGFPLESVVKRNNVDLKEETEYVAVNYDAASDKHLVRKCETEDTKWVSLANTTFRVVPGRPITRLENDE
jgi:hypothetical protein|uniref:Uncharacterized protein n=1 Tax=Globisporangium ultimum (strain ATCC 200006 / CBS 805.95 / DAOM BR144) TaxID=431595 RepID=K3WKV3_GLOUD